jgi:ATP-dependent DNA helicase RecQ
VRQRRPRGAPDGRAEAGEGAAAFPAGTRVRHPRFGAGVVQGSGDDRLTVLFDEAGYRTLAAELVAEEGILEPT